MTAAVGKAKRRLSVMATSRTRLKRNKETLTALQRLNIEVYNEELEVGPEDLLPSDFELTVCLTGYCLEYAL